MLTATTFLPTADHAACPTRQAGSDLMRTLGTLAARAVEHQQAIDEARAQLQRLLCLRDAVIAQMGAAGGSVPLVSRLTGQAASTIRTINTAAGVRPPSARSPARKPAGEQTTGRAGQPHGDLARYPARCAAGEQVRQPAGTMTI